ncbi:MAG TPA: 6-bladed beta-propeller [Longimicrobiaceae bacterium]
MLATALGVAGCGSERGAADRSPFPGEHSAPALTPAVAALLEEDFGHVVDVAAGRDGRVYVADGMTQAISVFSPQGKRLGTVGRRGDGPGEFQGIRDLVVGRGDSLFVLDVGAQRVSAFATRGSLRLAYTADVRLGAEMASYRLLVPEASGFVLQHTMPYAGPDASSSHRVRVHRFDPVRGPSEQSILDVPDEEFMVVVHPRFGYAVGEMPFGRRPVVQMGPGDRLYYGRNDSLRFTLYDLHGAVVGGFHQVYTAPPVRESEIERLLASYPDDRSGRMAKQTLSLAVERDQIPATKPLYRTFLVDDAGRIWLERITPGTRVVKAPEGLRYFSGDAGGKETRSWLVVDPAGRPVARVEVPGSSSLLTIRDGSAYAVQSDSLGTERVVRYTVPLPPGEAQPAAGGRQQPSATDT